MNTEKTRILTLTCKQRIVDRLCLIGSACADNTAACLQKAMKAYSKNKEGNPIKVTDGLRVLGVPSEQTMLQLYRQCTAHKWTHLFAADFVSKGGELPANWDCWSSHKTRKFDQMTKHFLSALTKQHKLPFSAMLINSMTVNIGGLGIPDLRTIAIPTFILNMCRCFQFSLDRVWIGHTQNNVSLPQPVTDLYSN